MHEFNFLKELASRVKTDHSVMVGIGDDTAVLQYKKDRYLLFTTDMIVEGTHFLLSTATPYQIGWKAMAVNLSDIAAMGGIPKWAVVSLGGPFQRQRTAFSVQRSEKNGRRTTDDGRQNVEKFVWEIYRGMNAVGKKFGVQIVGGDTDRAAKWTINVALVGEVEKKYLTLRSGARVGDQFFVTGKLGGSIHGKHLTFTPRIKEARYLVSHYPITSMIDLSDGLASDLQRVMEQSGVGFLIDEAKVPLSRYAKNIQSAFCDGEDFELLFTVPKAVSEKLKGAKIKWLSHIGEVIPASQGVLLRDRFGEMGAVEWKGYEHF